ncbi:hypothetical protein B4U80_05923 [Leptotrombidium deliense]|uniref:Uncharacterized protein n=1 Tax=Leptotrombidium deliense TaxID=299467 RepID=A0A443SUG8_9ACAR|nr:hypothetical protein B4U80_05923 [Leptotrombidium deliense]
METLDSSIRNVDEFTGVLEVVRQKQPQSAQKVLVVIHRTATEHFAVLYPLRLLPCARTALATINLKSSLIKRCDENLLRIQPRKDIDGISLTLRVPERDLISKWLTAFSSLNVSNKVLETCSRRAQLNGGGIRSTTLPPLLEDAES